MRWPERTHGRHTVSCAEHGQPERDRAHGPAPSHRWPTAGGSGSLGRVTASGATTTVGRDRELAEVTRLVDAAAAGDGGALLITGEAGIGKSRLLAETVALAHAAGFAVLSGRAVPGGGTYRPIAAAVLGRVRGSGVADTAQLRPFRAALARLAPGWVGEDLGGTGAGADPVLMLGEGLLQLLVAAGDGAGTLLVLDDLHWADPDTIALVEYVAARPGHRRCCSPSPPATTSRACRRIRGFGRRPAPGTGRGHHLAAAPARRPGGHAARIGVGRRPSPSRGRPRRARRAGRGVAGAGRGTAGGLLTRPAHRRRCRRPSPGWWAAASPRWMRRRSRFWPLPRCSGWRPDWGLLPLVTGQDEDAVVTALRVATGAGLLVRAAAALRWPHALTRDAVLETLLPPERAALAGRAADVLTVGPGPVTTRCRGAARGRRARLPGGDDPGAPRAPRHRQRRAAQRGRPDRPRGRHRRHPGTGHHDRVRLLTLLGRIPDALASGEPVLVATTGDAHAELCLELARAAVTGGRWAQARQYVDRAGRPADPAFGRPGRGGLLRGR